MRATRIMNGLAVLLIVLLATSCIVKESATGPDGQGASNSDGSSGDSTQSQGYSNVTGSWQLNTQSGFGNNEFTATMSVSLDLTQTGQPVSGYGSDVRALTGSFSGLSWIIQRKSDGTIYPLENAQGTIVNGAINTLQTSHNLQFDLANQNWSLQGVAPAYESMYGNIALAIDMTNLYGTNDGVITLTGMWDANRK